MEEKIVRILLNNYTKIVVHGGIAKVIFDDQFENIALEIVKLFDKASVSNSVCKHGDFAVIDGEFRCKHCKILYMNSGQTEYKKESCELISTKKVKFIGNYAGDELYFLTIGKEYDVLKSYPKKRGRTLNIENTEWVKRMNEQYFDIIDDNGKRRTYYWHNPGGVWEFIN